MKGKVMAQGTEGKQWVARYLRTMNWTAIHPRMEVYCIKDEPIFPIYAESGGLSAKYICYIIVRGDRGGLYDGGDLGRDGVKDCGKGWVRAAIEFTYEQITFSPSKVLLLIEERAKEAAAVALHNDLPRKNNLLRFASRVNLLQRRLSTKIAAFRAA